MIGSMCIGLFLLMCVVAEEGNYIDNFTRAIMTLGSLAFMAFPILKWTGMI